MLAIGVLFVIIGAASDSLSSDTVRLRAVEPDSGQRAVVAIAADDTVPRKRRRSVQVSDWYDRRLQIHRYVSYAVVPVFGAQWIAGNQIWVGSRSAPEWAKVGHRAGATALAGMFTVNTVTGLWNLWDSRAVEQGRLLRTVHAVTMLTADAGFTYAGARLSEQAENDQGKRALHRKIALSSMALTVASGLMMKIWNH